MSDAIRQQIMSAAGSVVVKIGTNVLTGDTGGVDTALVSHLAGSIAQLCKRGLKVTVVSSGAVGAGVDMVGLTRRPDDLPRQQACAAVGQAHLMRTFDASLKRRGYHAAQILITRDDFENRARYLNIRNCINALHELGAVPILNENDTVSVDELRYGDNDIIAALVTNNLRADVLVLLTVVDGLCRDAARGDVIDVVEKLSPAIERVVDSTRSRLGTGGMASKLDAVKMVTEAGEAAVIANGRRPKVLLEILDGKKVGTLFVPTPSKMTSRKRWIAFTARARGRLVVDDGAAAALRDKGKSLLASGIAEVGGRFKAGDPVAIVDASGNEIARGLSNYDSSAVETIRGHKSSEFRKLLGEKPYDEVVHRDNLVLRPSGK